MYIASVLRQAGHDPRIVEGTFENVIQQFNQLPLEWQPDFIGITCMTSQYHEIIEIRDYFHQLSIPFIFGGPHATVLPESLLTKEAPYDFVIQGEGEKTILKVIEGNVPAGVIQGERIESLDSLPFPARDLVPAHYFRNGRTSILASRGCPFNCAFCQPTLRKIFGEKIRRRNPSSIAREMTECNLQFGLDTFEFFDDTFTSDKDWVYDLCNQIQFLHFNLEILTRVDMLDWDLLKRMKDVGLKRISLGIETGSQEILNSYGKGTTIKQNLEAVKMCNHLGIKVHGFFMVGALTETRQTIEETKRFLKQVDFETIFVTVTMPLPGTRLYDAAKAEQRLWLDWDQIDYLGSLTTTTKPSDIYRNCPMILKHLDGSDILNARYEILRSFYWQKVHDPFYLWHFIRQNGLAYTWHAAKHILGM